MSYKYRCYRNARRYTIILKYFQVFYCKKKKPEIKKNPDFKGNLSFIKSIISVKFL